MKRCPKCGYESEAKFCAECGSLMEEIETKEPEIAAAEESDTKEAPSAVSQETEQKPMDAFDKLMELKKHLDAGVITNEEFEALKKQILETPNANASLGSLDSIFKNAKEKTGLAKNKANEKLEEMKKKQAEEAEKRKAAEEERKEKEKVLQAQKAEEARKAQEEKARKAAEKKKEKEERKAQNKQKRKEFFSKKSTKAAIAIICIAAIGLIGLKAYSHATRERMIGAFDQKDKYTINNLTYYVPKDWKEGDLVFPDLVCDQNLYEEKVYTHNDKHDKFLGAVKMAYLGEEISGKEVIDKIKEDINAENTDDYTLDSGGTEVSVMNTNATHPDIEDDIVLSVAVAEKDYSTFATCVVCTADAYDKETVDAILSAPEYGTYKNSRVAESLTVTYNGDRTGGYKASSTDFDVEINYKDGTSQKATSFTLDPAAPEVKDGETVAVKVSCHGISEETEIKGRTVKKLTATYSGKTDAGVEIAKGNADLSVNVEWDDGTKEPVTDYEMKTFKLKAGETSKADVTAYGETCTLKVECTTLSKEQYKNKCKERGYKGLLRDPSYGEYTKIYGKVVQDCGGGNYRITSGGSAWDDVYLVTVMDNKTLVEDDWVTCWGVTAGIYEYTTVMGASQKVPWLMAEYVSIK